MLLEPGEDGRVSLDNFRKVHVVLTTVVSLKFDNGDVM